MATFVGAHCTPGNIVYWETPWGIKVAVNRAVLRRFKLACRRAYNLGWDPKRIDSYNCRAIRGSSSWSRHAYACAWDWFYTGPGIPPPGGVWKPTDTFGHRFATCFTDLGFTWGSEWARADWPHIEWSGSTVPDLTFAERARTWKKYYANKRKAKKEARK